MYKDNAFGIDLSSWNGDVPLKKGDVDFLCVRLGGSESGGGIYKDTMFDKNVQKAQDIGVPCIAYFFVGPRYWLEKQFTMSGVSNLTNAQNGIYKFIHDELLNKNVVGLILDVEEASLKTSSGQVTSTWISFFVRDICNRFNKEFDANTFRKMRLGVYSRKSWMDVWGKDLGTWLGTQPEMMLWVANWPGGTTSTASLAEIRTKLPLEIAKPIPFGWTGSRVPLDWTLWQYGGDVEGAIKVKIQETGGVVDLNMFHGNVETMKVYLGISDAILLPVLVKDTEKRILKLESDLKTCSDRVEFLMTQFDKHLKVI
jgi:hypothetical protein